MKRFFYLIVIFTSMSLFATAQNEMIKVKSRFTVNETVKNVTKILNEKGLKVFTVIEHAKGAESVSIDLKPTTLILFGNPALGSKLMQCDQRAGIDLPMKFLVWEDKEGVVWIGYWDPMQLKTYYSLDACEAVLAKMSGAISKFADLASH